jgi:regulation of enolase protein 1 (concanavalin A-like superfamily)
MHRPAALLLCALVAGLAATLAGGLLAAPAPFPRPGRGPWYDGWDRPVDPVGDCQFARKGGTLTITVPGKGHELDIFKGRLNAPRLLREVEGDFVVQVRVRGDYRPADLAKPGMLRQAGLVLIGSKFPLKYTQSARTGESGYRLCGELLNTSGLRGGLIDIKPGPPLRDVVTLRVRRRGDEVWMTAIDGDGKKWRCNEGVAYRLDLAKKVKVGVFAESTASGTFRATFDQFRLAPLTS